MKFQNIKMNASSLMQSSQFAGGCLLSLITCAAIEIVTVRTAPHPITPKDLFLLTAFIVIPEAAVLLAMRKMKFPKSGVLLATRGAAGLIAGMILAGLIGLGAQNEKAIMSGFGELGKKIDNGVKNLAPPIPLNRRHAQSVVALSRV